MKYVRIPVGIIVARDNGEVLSDIPEDYDIAHFDFKQDEFNLDELHINDVGYWDTHGRYHPPIGE